MIYKFVPMNQSCASEIISNWRYDGDLAIYNYENKKDWILYEEAWGNGIFAVLNENCELIGELSVQFLYPSEVALETELGDHKVINK